MFDLPAGTVKHLTEISLTVEQTYSNQRQLKIACCLEMITGKHAKTTGKNSDALVDTELKRKISNLTLADIHATCNITLILRFYRSKLTAAKTGVTSSSVMARE